LPLLVKGASDLMAPYVCQTEQKLAKAFNQAEREELGSQRAGFWTYTTGGGVESLPKKLTI